MTRHFCNVLFSTFFLMATSCATAQSFENRPLQSQQRAEDISATSLIEVDLNGLGLDNVRWMGVAQYGHGPMQLVVEVPRASKWMGSTCLKFKNMVRVGEAWALNTGGYNIVYENTISSRRTVTPIGRTPHDFKRSTVRCALPKSKVHGKSKPG